MSLTPYVCHVAMPIQAHNIIQRQIDLIIDEKLPGPDLSIMGLGRNKNPCEKYHSQSDVLASFFTIRCVIGPNSRRRIAVHIVRALMINSKLQ
jgi:hypothetical protein